MFAKPFTIGLLMFGLFLKHDFQRKCLKRSAKCSTKGGYLSKRDQCLKKSKLDSLTSEYVTGCTNIMLDLENQMKGFKSPKKTEKNALLNTWKIFALRESLVSITMVLNPQLSTGIKCSFTETKVVLNKTLNLTGYETYVKENYNLSRERVTVFTQVGNDPTLNMKPDCFQEKGYSNKDQWT